MEIKRSWGDGNFGNPESRSQTRFLDRTEESVKTGGGVRRLAGLPNREAREWMNGRADE